MNASAVLILFLAFSSANAKTRTFEREPENDSPRETAPYKVIPFPKPRSYEKRVYPSLHWVSTDINCCEFMGYMRLFHYIGGQNSASSRMNMTTPAVTTWDISMDPFLHWKKKTVSFYIPQEFQQNPPQPTNPKVYLEYTPMTLFARTYTGYSTDLRFQEELFKLQYDLNRDGQLYDNTNAFFAFYNGPYDYRDRRNEVWLMARHK